VVVGGVVDVAPAPWPEAPVVPGLPVPAAPAAPPELPIALLGVAPVAVLLPVSPALVPVALHAAKDSVIMLPIRTPRTMFMIVSLWFNSSHATYLNSNKPAQYEQVCSITDAHKHLVSRLAPTPMGNNSRTACERVSNHGQKKRSGSAGAGVGIVPQQGFSSWSDRRSGSAMNCYQESWKRLLEAILTGNAGGFFLSHEDQLTRLGAEPCLPFSKRKRVCS
jgi:hypothetical protein